MASNDVSSSCFVHTNWVWFASVVPVFVEVHGLCVPVFISLVHVLLFRCL